MDIQLGPDRLSEERAFIQRYTDTISARPVNYKGDYTAPAETRSRKVGIVNIPLADPPLHDQPVAGPSNESLELTIKSLKPALTYTITAQPTDSVLDLKALVTAASSSSSSAGNNTVAVESQRLLLKGKALADNKLLKEYDLKSGAIVHLILKAPPSSAAGTMTSAAGLPAIVPSPSAPSSSLNPASGAVPDLGSASTAQQPKPSSIDLPRPSMGHARVPSLTITAEAPGSSPGSSSPGREIPLNLTDAPPLGPQAQVSSASFHQTIANPDFWQKVHELCVQEFPNEVDADQAWEAFLLSVKGRLSAGEAAKIRDVVGVRGMGGA